MKNYYLKKTQQFFLFATPYCLKKLIKLLWFMVFVLQTYSQQTSFVKGAPEFFNIATPNAASFNKFIDRPVSLYHGSPDVNIPIYTIRDGEIELPIVLRYNTSGIKVDEEASWVGLGWNLNAGGVITKQVVGENDVKDNWYLQVVDSLNLFAFPNNYIEDHFRWFITFSTCQAHYFIRYDQEGIGTNRGKLNPDVFYYSYPNDVGKFFIDYRDSNIYIINRGKNIKIEILNYGNPNPTNTDIGRLKITTEQGIEHTFEFISEIRDPNPVNPPPSSTSFILKKSVYPNGQQVDYEYDKRYVSKTIPYEFCQKTVPDSANPPSGGSYSGNVYYNGAYNVLKGYEFYLTSIATTNYSIIFELEDREDLQIASDFTHEKGKMLSKINIFNKSNSSKIKEYYFDYDYFETPNSNPSLIYFYKRLKLNSVYEKQGNTIINRYNFDYNTTILPAKNSKAVDYWGYYNGINNTTLLPNLNLLLWSTPFSDSYTLSILKIAPYTTHAFTRANRGYDFESCQTAILTGIEYPTGGYCKFEYEPNKFSGYFIPTAQQGKTKPMETNTFIIDNNDRPDSTFSFTFQSQCEIAIDLTISRGIGSWYDVTNAEIVILKYEGNNSTTIKKFNYNNQIYQRWLSEEYYKTAPPTVEYNAQEKLLLNAGTYKVAARLPDELGNQNGASTLHYSIRANINYKKPEYLIENYNNEGAGIRVASIKQYLSKNNNTPEIITEYGYTGGILHEKIEFAKLYRNIAVYFEDGHMYHFDIAEVTSSNIISNPYGMISCVGYTNVTEKKIQNSQSLVTAYKFFNSKPCYARHSVRVDKPLNGWLEEVKRFKQSNAICTEKYNYTFTSKRHYFGVNYIKRWNIAPGIWNNSQHPIKPEFWGYNLNISCDQLLQMILGSGYPVNLLLNSSHINFIRHDLYAYDIILSSKETWTDNVYTKESFSYNPSTLQLESSKLSKSDGNDLEYKYFYANDYDFAPYTNMTDKNMLSQVIEEKVFNNNLYIGGKLTKYKSFNHSNNTMYVPDKKYFSEVASPLTNPPTTFNSQGENTTIYPNANIKFENQTAYGKPRSITYNDADRVVYLWGYNFQFPIAEIKGVSFSDVTNKISESSINTIAAKKVPTDSDWNSINSLRSNLPNAMVTTYKYNPLEGIESITDPHGITTYFNYDEFGRLINIKIGEKTMPATDETLRTIEEYLYNYKQ